MAIVTKQLAMFDNGNVTLEIDYDDATLLLRAVRCVNNSAQPCAYRATHLATGRNVSGSFAAGRTVSVNIPTNAAARMQITIDARGRVDGVEYQLSWPA